MEAQESQDIALPACVLEQRSITPSEQAVAMTDTDTYIDRAERAEADLFQARQAAFQEGVGRAAVERERDELRALLRECRDHSIYLPQELVSRIDSALKDKVTHIERASYRAGFAAGLVAQAQIRIPTDTMEQEFAKYERRGYAAGIEAAAKACEEQGRNAGDGMTFYTATGQCAAAIRALKDS